MLIGQLYPEHRSREHADNFTFGYDWGVIRHGSGFGRAEICLIQVLPSIDNC
jgi:hypothetical protein